MKNLNKRIKPEQKVICNISLGGRFTVYSEESLIKLFKLNIKENDFVIIFDTTNGERNLGKLVYKKPKRVINKKDLINLSENIILKKATLLDKLLDKMGLL